MRVSVTEAFGLVCAMGAVILFCRAFPFLFFSNQRTSRSKGTKAFLDFVERIAPPVAMTVLAFNALAPSFGGITRAITSPLKFEDFQTALAVIIAAILTALIHIWKRNALISIFIGTAVYMIILRGI